MYVVLNVLGCCNHTCIFHWSNVQHRPIPVSVLLIGEVLHGSIGLKTRQVASPADELGPTDAQAGIGGDYVHPVGRCGVCRGRDREVVHS